MQANKKNREKCQRRSLRIEKFEHRIVPAASIFPMDPMNVDLDVEDLRLHQPAVVANPQGCHNVMTDLRGTLAAAQVNQLRDGKGLETWTAGDTTGVVEKLAESVKGYMTADSFLDGHAEEKPTNSGGYQEDSSIWSDGTFTSVVEKLAPVVNGLWHDAIPEEDFGVRVVGKESRITFPDDLGPPGIWTDGTINNVIEKLAPTVNDLWHDAGEEEIPVVASASENVNGITVPDDWGPPGIWTTGPVSSIVEQLIPAGLTDLAKPNAVTAGVIDKQRPTGLEDMAEPTSTTSGVVEKLAPAVDQIFHDAGEADIPVVAEPSALFILEAWLKGTFRS